VKPIQVQFLGSGDAFGSGGRLQTCILVEATTSTFLIDCGTTALIAMRRFGVNPNDIDLILLTHLHGDHFGGIPFFVLDAQLISKRSRPLIIAGPSGTKRRIAAAMEVFFPGSSQVQQRFLLDIRELAPEQSSTLDEVAVTPYPVQHPSGDPSLALRIGCAGKILTYTGDTQWTETLPKACRGADLLIAEAYFFEKHVPFHLDLQTLLAHLDELQPKRLVVTHMSDDMLSRLEELPCDSAEDGTCIEV
jgi:ribonuclease BN (tRNA processing enzyme)